MNTNVRLFDFERKKIDECLDWCRLKLVEYDDRKTTSIVNYQQWLAKRFDKLDMDETIKSIEAELHFLRDSIRSVHQLVQRIEDNQVTRILLDRIFSEYRRKQHREEIAIADFDEERFRVETRRKLYDELS